MRVFLLILCLSLSALAESASSINWQSWEGAFDKAQAENKLVLLDLEAVWCHWCHVMDRTTYASPEVARLLSESVVPVKVDQDSRPDLSNRYKDYGWPATIIFDSQGRELAKLSGYVSADRLASILQRLKENPVPLKDVAPPVASRGTGTLSPELLKSLKRRHFRLYDDERGAWGRIHKFVNGPVVEYCLSRSLQGDKRNRAMARQTLDANLALLDPIWGGVYQYSDSGVWDSPHFEKIMSTQAANLKVYSLAYSQFEEDRYLRAADSIADYLVDFWRDENGGFYTSQDADLVQGVKANEYFSLDDKERRALGLPRIDKHQYARENGLAIEALALYSAISGKPKYLGYAKEAAAWLLAERAYPNGGFLHSLDQEKLFLGDTLQASRAFLMLYRVTGEKDWMERAEAGALFIQNNFSRTDADGFFSSQDLNVRDRKENVDLARFANLLHSHTGNQLHADMAKQALAYFSIESVTDFFNPGGILLATEELATEPTHITVVGSRADEDASALFKRAAASPTTYLRLDFWEPETPKPPFTQVDYPVLKEPALYLCTGKTCSAPIFEPEALREFWKRN